MCALNGYDVPAEISAIAQRNGQLGAVTPKELTTLFSSMDKTTETGYKKAYSTMIHFEEAAQSQIVVQFNTKDIQLSYSGNGREFRIAITVRCLFVLISNEKEEPRVGSRLVSFFRQRYLRWLKP